MAATCANEPVCLPRNRVGIYSGDHLVRVIELTDARERFCNAFDDDTFTAKPLPHVDGDLSSEG